MAKKYWGQHFFWNKGLAKKIINLIEIKESDLVVEIGPGKGILTEIILEKTKNVIAVEIDKELAKGLKNKFPNLNVLNKDFLRMNYDKIIKKDFKLISNLPYKISSPTLFKLFELKNKFIEGVLVIQKELAERIVSEHGSKKYSPISIILKNYFILKIAFHLSPGSFNPPPKVDSSALIIKKREKPKFKLSEPDKFKSFIDKLFRQRRKMIKNNMNDYELNKIDDCNILKKRAEQLSEAELVNIYKSIYENS